MLNFKMLVKARTRARASRRSGCVLEELETRALRTGGLSATYYDGLEFNTPRLARVDANVNFSWGIGSPGAGFNPDRFSARWAGTVEAPATGNYTFSTLADDGVRLWVDGKLLINNWTAHPPTEDLGSINLVAGRKYDLVLEYFESGGWSSCVLSWASPAMAKQVIPSSALSPRTGSGLQATYYTDTNLTTPAMSRVDANVNFSWGVGSPAAGFNPDRFSARWAGTVEAPATGNYTFSTLADDGVRLWVDGKLLINNWTAHPPTEDLGSITLVAGRKYDLKLEYFESGGWSTCVLSWASPAMTKQVIPSSALSPGSSLTVNPPPPTPGPPLEGPWRLLLEESFDTLNPSLWSTRYWWNGDRGTQATFDPSGLSISDGVLSLTARREARTTVDGVTNPYTSGLITTGGIEGVKAPGFTFQYGYVEARTKIAPGWGMWSAFWMLPASHHDGQAEIDLLENLGRQPDVFNAFYHRADHGVNFENKMPTGVDLSADWHVYGLDWQADHIAWYLDGVEVGRYQVAAEVVAEPMYLILNLDVGGAWAGPVNANTPATASWQVDYIKVWQH